MDWLEGPSSFTSELNKPSKNRFWPHDPSVCPPSASGGAPESSPPAGLPAAEFGPPGAAAAEVLEPGEDSACAGVSAPQTGPGAAQPEAALLPQTVEARRQEGHRLERCLRGALVLVWFCKS